MRPKAKKECLFRERSGDSTFIYDRASSLFHELNSTAARVMDLCDGTRTIPQIATALPEEIGGEREALVFTALAQLDHAQLMEIATPEATAFSRRRFAAFVAAPIVMSVTIPAHAGPPSSGGDGVGSDVELTAMIDSF